MRIDLHTHTTASDGTDSPAGLIEAAATAGLDVVAITDHDSAAGWPLAAAAVRQLRAAGRPAPTLVPGIEVSCERTGRSVHLLGYLLDPAHPPLVAELTRARDSRASRLERMVARLAEGGIPITYAAVLAHVPPGATPGRPHIADALVAAGVVAHRDEAFARWLHDASPYYVTHYAPDPARAVELVLAAGGVPVLAHPFSAGRSASQLSDALVAELAAVGLVGLEVEHPDHDPAAAARARSLAAGLGLLATGASDYHGTGKTVGLGARVTDPGVWQAIRERGRGSRELA